MRKLLLILVAMIMALTPSWGFNDLDKTLSESYKKNNTRIENKRVDDYTFVRRIYIDLAGRIPTTEEIKAYVISQQPNKRELIIDKILFSEDYTNNFYNFWADLLRIRPERLGDGIQMKSYPYMEYVRDFIREDKPYNTFVESLLTAKGKITDNAASSYFIRDEGMAFDNLAITSQIFIGKDIACAICHDDPFQDYSQKQFYELAAFLNNTNRENRKDYRDVLKKVDDEIKTITKTDRIDNNVRQLMSSNLFNISDDPNKKVIYPPDYAYTNAKPGEIAIASSLDGKLKDVKENKRATFAKWIIDHEDFPSTIANRIWENLVGNNLFYPESISNFNKNSSPSRDLVLFLDQYLKQNNYSIRSLVKLIVLSDFYSRPAYLGSREGYKNEAILVKRLDAYKIWDSVLTLVLEDPNYSRISFDKYADLFEIDWEKVSGQGLLDQTTKLRDYEKSLSDNFLKFNGIELVRACFLLNRNNGFVATFLKEFGASERVLIDTNENGGSITQLLTLMNSPLMGIIADKKSQVIQSYEREHRNKDIIFISIMGRPVGIFERDLVNGMSPSDLVWVLLNTKEFLFRK
jgi:hypothetical protein